jgi:hypothetical protein
VLSCANNLVSERYRSSLNRSWNCTFLILVLISYLRFDHSYPDNTELFLFLLFLLSPSPAILVRSAYGRTTPHSGSDNAFFSTWVSWNHGRVLLQNYFSFFCSEWALLRKVTRILAIVSSLVLVRAHPSCFRECFYYSIQLFSCFFAFPFTDIRQNNILFSQLFCPLCAAR